MKADRRMKESCRGSTVLYAVFLSALLAVLGTAFLTAGAYSRRETAWQMRYGQAQVAARSLHKSFCQAVRGDPAGGDGGKGVCIRRQGRNG